MIHHVSVDVSDLERSARFYDAVLGSLGWRRHIDDAQAIAWGIVRPVFFAVERGGVRAAAGHVCFAASGISAVEGAWEGGIAPAAPTTVRPGRGPSTVELLLGVPARPRRPPGRDRRTEQLTTTRREEPRWRR